MTSRPPTLPPPPTRWAWTSIIALPLVTLLLIVGVMYFVAITILTWLANIVDRKVNR